MKTARFEGYVGTAIFNVLLSRYDSTELYKTFIITHMIEQSLPITSFILLYCSISFQNCML